MMPETLGSYQILGELGRGGMGIVYRARHLQSERAVALKTVKPDLMCSTKWLEGLRREIAALTRIRHPGIVRIVDHGVSHGMPWYAMDLLEGERLEDFCRRVWSPYRWGLYWGEESGLPNTHSLDLDNEETAIARDTRPPPFPYGKPPAAAGQLRPALRLMRRLCATLGYLHGEGLVSCDLTPRNILLVEGEPVIIDFGLSARHPGGTSREAVEPLPFAGTLPYMSPEQLRGELVDARSDLYAAGCLLYELVVGRPPFIGPHRVSLQLQHAHGKPTPPSELVAGVCDQLERLMFKLLETNPFDRCGHADDVSAELAELADDARRLPHFPPSRSYLYRPRLVGRDDILERLSGHRDKALRGTGSFVLLGGESGMGKSRVAMELTRAVGGLPMRVVSTEASALAAAHASALVTVPLQALRPLLQAIADRCIEGGPETTEHLLGERRAVLAAYEPTLAHVPALEPMNAVVELAPEAARERLFRYLKEALALYAQDCPVLWIWDDLGWADNLSLSFLLTLDAEFFDKAPLMLLGAYRKEEMRSELQRLLELPHTVSMDLERLDPSAVRNMLEDMLALRLMPGELLDFVTQQADGNPFFVAEYLRAAVTERVVQRSATSTWQVNPITATADRPLLTLPGTVRELVERRLRQLTPVALQAALTAAVLGREVALEQLEDVAGLSGDASLGAVDELVRAHVLEHRGAALRFAHDQVREVAYTKLAAEQKVALHGRAADCLERASCESDVAHEHWANLAFHHERAQRIAPAVKYLSLAARHARASFANDQAIDFYRKALELIQGVTDASVNNESPHEQTLELWESLGEVLAITSRREEARSAFSACLDITAKNDRLRRARLLRKLGKTWEAEHRHDEALRCYATGRETIGDVAQFTEDGLPQDAVALRADGPLDQPLASALRDEWVQLHVEQLWVYYWLNRVDDMSQTVSAIEPVVHVSSPLQRAKIFHALAMKNLRRDRYTVVEETLALVRQTLDMYSVGPAPLELPMVQFFYGFCLMLHGSLDEADTELRKALVLAERAGDIAHQARCATYLAVVARRRGDVVGAQAYTTRSTATAIQARVGEYLAASWANQSWIDLHGGSPEACERHASQAMAKWQEVNAAFPFRWLAVLPLLQVQLERDIAAAMTSVEALLAPTQHLFCAEAFERFVIARQWFRDGDAPGASVGLRHALDVVRASGYS